MKFIDAYPVIMCGGSGTRFWPASTADFPKQFLSIVGKKPLLSQTIERIEAAFRYDNIYLIGNKRHKKVINELSRDLPSSNVVLEPVGRNTAPTIALASLLIKERYGDGVLVILPSDHYISKKMKFLSLLRKGVRIVNSRNAIVTLGILPSVPHTGYGYIEVAGEFDKGVYRVKRFVEKPSLKKAKSYIAGGSFYWNSGIFIFKASYMLRTLLRYVPELMKRVEAAFKYLGRNYDKFSRYFSKSESISIDYAVMEHDRNIFLIPADIGWDDLGNWDSAGKYGKNMKRNSILRLPCGGRFNAVESKGNVIYSDSLRSISLLGVSDLIVVDAGDNLLIADRRSAESVKLLTQK